MSIADLYDGYEESDYVRLDSIPVHRFGEEELHDELSCFGIERKSTARRSSAFDEDDHLELDPDW